MTPKRIGYARVSTAEQNFNTQLDALNKAWVEMVFFEKVSGVKSERLELGRAFEELDSGDTLVITRLDRLARSVSDLLDIASKLAEKNINLEVIEQPEINTKTEEGKHFFKVAAQFSQLERDLIVSRTKAGLAAARARGRVGGRKPKLTKTQIEMVKELYTVQQLSVIEISRRMFVSRATIYRVLEK